MSFKSCCIGSLKFLSHCKRSSTSCRYVSQTTSVRKDQRIEPVLLVRHASTKAVKLKQTPLSEMIENDASLELKQLNAEISRHDQLYYDQNDPSISDTDYDKLLRRASDIAGKFGNLRTLVTKLDSVGSNINSKLAPFQHTRRMLSLDNAFNESEILSFIVKTEKLFLKNSTSKPSTPLQYVVEPKIDGLSLALHYVDGVLVKAGTRGDGQMGEDVTTNVMQHIQSIPQKITTSEKYLEVRGEVYISRGDFIELNKARLQNGETEFSTARNAAAGSLRRVLGGGGIERRLKFFAYGLFAQEATGEVEEKKEQPKEMADTQSGLLEKLVTLGFQVAKPTKVCTSPDKVVQTCLAFEQAAGSWDYDTDGAVLKVDHLARQHALGNGTKAPKWAVAYKFTGLSVQTVIEDIVVQVGRTGLLTPVAILAPVMIGGVRVERATLHNANEVRRLGLFKGARVVVKRAGEVIPKVVGLVDEADKDSTRCFELPAFCPVCGSAAVADGNGTVRCSGGITCGAQAVEQIRHFCSRDAADIDGVSGKKLEYLFTQGFVHSVLDLYTLRERDEASGGGGSREKKKKAKTLSTDLESQTAPSTTSLRGHTGWGDRSVSNMLAAIDASRQSLTMPRLLYGLGIPQVGLQTAKDLNAQFEGDFGAFWAGLKECASGGGNDTEPSASLSFVARLSAISGLGPVATQSLFSFARDPRNVAVVDGLIRHLPMLTSGGKVRKAPVVTAPKVSKTTGNKGEKVPRGEDSDIASSANVEPIAPSTTPSPPSPLAGRHVVFTGAMKSMTRKQAQEVVEAMGGVNHSSVNNSVNLLVDCREEGAQMSAKAVKAAAKGVEVWSEEQWTQLMDEEGGEGEEE